VKTSVFLTINVFFSTLISPLCAVNLSAQHLDFDSPSTHREKVSDVYLFDTMFYLWGGQKCKTPLRTRPLHQNQTQYAGTVKTGLGDFHESLIHSQSLISWATPIRENART
jgi:hypothetical protein